MLDSITLKKLEDFVYIKPRSMQEISHYMGKSWRTADRYVQEIEKEYGTIATRTFREGTRGALKIVYWASVEKLHASVFQEKIEKEIETFKKKEDFSAFDIYQHVTEKDKKAYIEYENGESKTNLEEFREYLESAKKQVIFFSGNLSWINLKDGKINIFDVVEKLVKKKIPIKILCRVDLASLSNVEKILSLNFKYGKELIEVRHAEHPLRGFIVDKIIMRLKEIKEPTGKVHELKNRLFIFYTIKDREWIDWLTRVFWKIFSCSINANKRIEELRKL